MEGADALNIVRLRYADARTFLDVSPVVSACSVLAGVQGNANLNLGTPDNYSTLPNAVTSLGVAAGFNDRPTKSYTPLADRKFAQSLRQPIPPHAIFSLIAGGCPVDEVISMTVQRKPATPDPSTRRSTASSRRGDASRPRGRSARGLSSAAPIRRSSASSRQASSPRWRATWRSLQRP